MSDPHADSRREALRRFDKLFDRIAEATRKAAFEGSLRLGSPPKDKQSGPEEDAAPSQG